ncbi:MAG: glycosyltransferase [Acidobacteriota bacterium]
MQAILLDGHFLIEHLARNRSGRFFNFNGTAGIWRRACIEEAGGWQHETLTEDLDLSYRAQLQGWRFVFLPDVVTPAELPAGMRAFKSQQHRWAKGSVETARKLLGRILKARHLPLATRMEAFFHLTENFAYLFMIVLAVLLWPSIVVRRQMHASPLSFIDLPVFVLASLSVAFFYVQSQRRAGRGWWASLLSIPAVMGLGSALALNNGGAVLEALVGRKSAFIRTPKDGLSDGQKRRRRPASYRSSPSVLPLLESVFALYMGLALLDVARRGGWSWIPFLIIFFWGFASTAALGWREVVLWGPSSARGTG